ncbi:mycofactocin biosynthesis chaperone MftB [Dermatophilaceae bacterium Soc4.6]
MPDMLGQAWCLSESVSLRPEPFGALAYDFRTRRLSFLKTPALVEVVRLLGESPCVADALVGAGVDASEHASYARALRTLADSGILTPRTTQPEEILV